MYADLIHDKLYAAGFYDDDRQFDVSEQVKHLLFISYSTFNTNQT